MALASYGRSGSGFRRLSVDAVPVACTDRSCVVRVSTAGGRLGGTGGRTGPPSGADTAAPRMSGVPGTGMRHARKRRPISHTPTAQGRWHRHLPGKRRMRVGSSVTARPHGRAHSRMRSESVHARRAVADVPTNDRRDFVVESATPGGGLERGTCVGVPRFHAISLARCCVWSRKNSHRDGSGWEGESTPRAWDGDGKGSLLGEGLVPARGEGGKERATTW